MGDGTKREKPASPSASVCQRGEHPSSDSVWDGFEQSLPRGQAASLPAAHGAMGAAVSLRGCGCSVPLSPHVPRNLQQFLLKPREAAPLILPFAAQTGANPCISLCSGHPPAGVRRMSVPAGGEHWHGSAHSASCSAAMLCAAAPAWPGWP